ncbi:MAG TPA: O-antigen ligase family protein [Gaiellaceae bacterium]|nr:O-antigen ligase family protein [Gaiellaceae bacterium]
MSDRLRAQLEGALQATIAGLVIAIAFVASHIRPWNVPEFRPLRTFVLFELAVLTVAYVVVSRARVRRLPGMVVVGAFTAVALLSTAWSVSPRLTLERGAGFAALIIAAGALGTAVAARRVIAAQAAVALVVATVLIAVAGLVELWHAFDQAVLPATKGQGWRYNGIGQNPNQVAMLIGITSPLTLWMLRTAPGRLRLLAWGSAVVLAGTLVASGSRGAIFATFAGCVVYLLATVERRRVAVAVAAAVVFVGAISATQLPQPADENPVLNERFGATPKLSPRDLNAGLPLESELGFPGQNAENGPTRTLFFTSGRLEAWELAVRQSARRPVAGYGFGAEDETFIDRSYLFVSDIVENSFIGALLQLGLVGLGLLVVALVLPLAAWWRARDESDELAAAYAGTSIAGIVLAVPQSYLTSVGSPPTAPFWIAFFVLAGLSAARARS